MKPLTKLANIDLREYFARRKMRNQMMSVLKNGYEVKFKAMTKEKVFGKSWKERLLDVYMVGIITRDFTDFHRIVKPIAQNMDAKLFDWDDMLSKDGKLLRYRKVVR